MDIIVIITVFYSKPDLLPLPVPPCPSFLAVGPHHGKLRWTACCMPPTTP